MGFARQLEFDDALVSTAIVVALYVFVGNSGVISFGHISFVAVGAYLSGILTLGAEQKDFVIPTMYPFLRHAHVATVPSLALAALAGAVFALLVGIPLMRLSGLPAGIATFAVLGITYNLISYWQKIGPGVTALALVPESGIWTLFVGTLITIVVAFAYSLSRSGRKLRATREDPQAAQSAGIHVHRQRLFAFVISGALAGFAGGLLVHELGSITTDQVYLAAHLHHARDARRRRRHEPLGRGRRRARDQRPQLVPERRRAGDPHRVPPRPPGRDAPRGDRRRHGGDPDPPPVRHHGRARGHAAPAARLTVAAATCRRVPA